MKILGPALLFTTVLAAPSVAQRPVQTDSARTCREYEATLANGGPPEAVKRARWNVGYCGGEVWGRAYAAGMSRLRHSTDVAELDEFWQVSLWLLDANIYRVALAVAQDASASLPARIYAIRSLALLQNPHAAITYEEMATAHLVGRGPNSGYACVFNTTPNGRPYHGTPLPSGYEEEIDRVLQQLLTDPGLETALRAAAQCGIEASHLARY